jgi:chromatin assembly factor 1 subunit A
MSSPNLRDFIGTLRVKDILLQLQISDDSTQSTQNQSVMPTLRPQELLRKVPMKSLKFGEDIRPPYQKLERFHRDLA